MGVCTLSTCLEDWNAAWNWKRDKRSVVTLCFPGICFARKWILYESVANTKRLIKCTIDLSFDVWLFMIWSTAMLSDINKTFLSLILLPKISMAKTMRTSSFSAIWYLTRSSSQEEANHEDPSVAAKPWQPDEYVCRVTWSDDNHFGGKKKDLPLNDLMNVNYMYVLMSAFDSTDNWSLLFGSDKPHVRSISLRRKARPGTTAEHEKIGRPIRLQIC